MNGSSITGANPIVITSGTLNESINLDNTKVKMFYWFQPDLTSTSSLVLTKGDATGVTYLQLKCETSGQSQTLTLDKGQWMDQLYCRCVPSGTLFIYTH